MNDEFSTRAKLNDEQFPSLPMASNPRARLSPICLDDLGDLDEERVLATMAMLGSEAFEQGDEEMEWRIYPFPELIRNKMTKAAFQAPALGFTAWARDSAGMAGADILAARRDEGLLLRLLREHPIAPPSKIWSDRIYGKLWLECADAGLFDALDAIGSMAPAPAAAWSAATTARTTTTRLFSAMAKSATSMSDLPCDAFCLTLAHGSAEDLKVLFALPDFKEKLGRHRSPWKLAAEKHSQKMIQLLAALGAPMEGWIPERWIGLGESTPLGALARNKDLRAPQWISLAELLAEAGAQPSSSDLDEALALGPRGNEFVDWLEAHGARPSKHSPQLCLEPCPEIPGICRPNPRLVKWMLSGSVDMLEALASGASANREELSWPRQFIASCARASLAERQSRSSELLRCLAASKCWGLGDGGIAEALIPRYRTRQAPHAEEDARAIANAFGGYGSSSREGAMAWWEAAIMSAGLPSEVPPRLHKPRL